MTDVQQKKTFNLFDRFVTELEKADRVVIETKNAAGAMDAYYLHAPSLRADLPATDVQVMQNERVKTLVEALRWYSDDPSSQGDVARTALAAIKEGQNDDSPSDY